MKQKKMTRLLAGLLALVLLLSLVPVAFAAEPLTELPATDGMQMSKTATLEADGTVTIRLEAYATGTTTVTEKEEGVPLDIVLVLDQSGSMTEDMDGGATYTARQSQGYSYSDLRNKSYYYLHSDGNYYEVSRVNEGGTGGLFGSDPKCYLTYAVNGTTYYLTGTTATTEKPSAVTSTNSDIWTGVLYSYSSGTISRLQALKNAATNFLTDIRSDAESSEVEHRVAIVGFASTSSRNTYTNTELLSTSSVVNYGSATSTDYKNALVNVNSTILDTAIERLAASGDTYSEYGVDMANKIFEQYPIEEGSDRKRVVVVFTDGYTAPSGTNDIDYSMSDRAIANAYTAKHTHGASVYSIGVFDDADPAADINSNFSYGSTNDTPQLVAANRYMHYMSNNFPDAQSLQDGGTQNTSGSYYLAASNAAALNAVFETISNEVFHPSTSVKLTTESVMKDIINPAALVLPELPEGTEIGSIVKIETWAGSRASAEAPVVFTEQTETAENVSVIVDEATGTVSVTGFDYSEKFIAPTHDGEKLVVIITGLVPSEAAATGEEVDTNAQGTGIYENAEATEYIPFNHPTLCVPVHSYVIDYAKPFGFSATEWNEKINLIKTLAEKMGCVTDNLKAELDMVNGKVVFTDTDLTYTTQTMNWNGYDSFYALTQDSAALNQWNKVNIIPATSVYYEDTFVTNEATGTVGITYTGEWSTAEAGANQETAGPVQGWVESLADDATVSDGTEATTSTAGAKATFNFTGTGVDIYSRTNLEAGVIRVKLFKVTDSGESMIKYLKMDCESASGEYYQIPTAFFSGLEHGEYKVELEVISTSTSNANYSLDGIRVYNPLATGDKTVNDAYADNGISVDAVFTCLRDLLKDANALAPTESGLPQFSEEFANGNAVFIDKAEAGTTGVLTTSVGTYLEYGPKNEVYLAPGQALTFKVNGTPAYTYVGIKAPEGTGSATFSNNGEAQNATLSAADLYYAVTPDANGAIVITNSGDKIISVTKLVTPAAEGSALMNLSAEAAIEAVNAFSALPVAEYTGNTVTETPAEPEAPVEPDPTEPEIPDVEIENPEQPEEPEEPVVVIGWLQQLFSALRNWFRT